MARCMGHCNFCLAFVVLKFGAGSRREEGWKIGFRKFRSLFVLEKFVNTYLPTYACMYSGLFSFLFPFLFFSLSFSFFSLFPFSYIV